MTRETNPVDIGNYVASCWRFSDSTAAHAAGFKRTDTNKRQQLQRHLSATGDVSSCP